MTHLGPRERCPLCWELAKQDAASISRYVRPEWRYAKIVALWHGSWWRHKRVIGSHLKEPFRL